MSNTDKSISSPASKYRKPWNYHPVVPIQVSPVFRSPFNLLSVFKWFAGSWFPISEKLILVGLALISWFYFHPELSRCINFELAWMAEIFVRNLILMIIVAGGLHSYFYIFKSQGDRRKYDVKPLLCKNRVFTFNDQVLDNMFWTCASGASPTLSIVRTRSLASPTRSATMCSGPVPVA